MQKAQTQKKLNPSKDSGITVKFSSSIPLPLNGALQCRDALVADLAHLPLQLPLPVVITRIEVGFKIVNPLKGYGFLTISKDYAYLLELKPPDPAIWHGVCIVKSPYNDGKGSQLAVYHDVEVILVKKIPDQAFNFNVLDFYAIQYGVDFAMLHSTNIEDCVFYGESRGHHCHFKGAIYERSI
ncbi:unnamed protein product [Lepeophtheirus salmonis]|uniref:(salmon louse) hypothetical protein n=1 Tax=Lepeophtheirus salmonis TaxID=72036 RepID=A0A7R8D4P0_LEPSM|nr:unnamed protein product [Lepeophtheirus salmonis]CAF3027106.1 unnamed protein product [Lepeophtheirus salmonis]